MHTTSPLSSSAAQMLFSSRAHYALALIVTRDVVVELVVHHLLVKLTRGAALHVLLFMSLWTSSLLINSSPSSSAVQKCCLPGHARYTLPLIMTRWWSSLRATYRAHQRCKCFPPSRARYAPPLVVTCWLSLLRTTSLSSSSAAENAALLVALAMHHLSS